MPEITNKQKFYIYRANKDITGSAINFEYSPEKSSVFLVACPQIKEQTKARGEKVFGWDKAIITKLDVPDLGAFLTVLNGWCDSINGDKGLYHQVVLEDGKVRSKSIKFARSQSGTFGLSIAYQDENKVLTKIFCGVSLPEAAVLKVFLEDCVSKLLTIQ